jgi:hypothetical protein
LSKEVQELSTTLTEGKTYWLLFRTFFGLLLRVALSGSLRLSLVVLLLCGREGLSELTLEDVIKSSIAEAFNDCA